ncbi:thioredoxin family protein [Brevibacillus dissolubilis]|uniref:thioredoxin family protein n=1 Tax=Brevibacillus dissolubilis TaxID=1844116 RepID=UPI00159BC5C0|nr:thioredoxin family protein [Brevibacillus dissolubilis]
MVEWTPQELMQRLEQTNSKPFVLYIYTPLCGTCKLTERMLTIVEELLPGLPLAKVNISSIPKLVQTWKITSVPCLLFLQNGQITNQVYAMKSIEHLVALLQPFIQTNLHNQPKGENHLDLNT